MTTPPVLPIAVREKLTHNEIIGLVYPSGAGVVDTPGGVGGGAGAHVTFLAQAAAADAAAGLPKAAALVPGGVPGRLSVDATGAGSLTLEDDDDGAALGPAIAFGAGLTVSDPAAMLRTGLLRMRLTGTGMVKNAALFFAPGAAPAVDPCADPLAAAAGWGDTFCYDDLADFFARGDFTETFNSFDTNTAAINATPLVDGHPTLDGDHAGASMPPRWVTELPSGFPLGASALVIVVAGYSSDWDVVESVVDPAAAGGGHAIVAAVTEDGTEAMLQLSADGSETVRLCEFGPPFVEDVIGARTLVCGAGPVVAALHVAGAAANAWVYPYGDPVPGAPSATIATGGSGGVQQAISGEHYYDTSASAGARRVVYYRVIPDVDLADVPALLALVVPNGL